MQDDDQMDFTDMQATGQFALGVAAPAPFRPTISRHYDAAVARAFFEACGQRENIAANTTLFVENEKSSKQGIFTRPIGEVFAKNIVHRMYLLAEGEVDLTVGGKPLETIKADGVFGEMAVISEIPGVPVPAYRSATAITKTECIAYSLDGEQTQAGLAKAPEFALMIMSVMFERLRFLAARLAARGADASHTSYRSDPVFDQATLTALEEKLERATIVRFAERAKIMREGQPGTSMYIVLEGRVSVAINNKIVEKMPAGGVFGEMALVDQSPRTASAVARTDCVLLSINRPTLIGLVKSDPAIGMAMMRAIAQRIRYMNSLFV